jgi:hypothetical protein
MKYILIFTCILILSCGKTRDKIRLNSVKIYFFSGSQIASRLNIISSNIALKENEGLMLLKFDMAYVGSKANNGFSGSVEPGLSGVEKEIKMLEVFDYNQKSTLTSNFEGVNMTALKLDGNAICVNYIDSLASLKDKINDKKKPFAGTKMNCFFMFKYDTKTITDTSGLKVFFELE